MSEPTDGTVRHSAANATLATLRGAMHAGESASTDAGEAAAECPHCGREFGNAGAAATHAKACEGEGEREAEPETEDSGGSDPEAYEPGDMRPSEIGQACERMSAGEARATLAALDRESPDGERVQATASKALANAHPGMDATAYTAAFGECQESGCEYGKNGIDAEYCARHEDADTHEGEPEPEPAKGDGETPDMSKAAYVKALVDEGLTPTKAAEAAEAVYGGDA